MRAKIEERWQRREYSITMTDYDLCFFGRPRGRSVSPRPSRAAVCEIQDGLPNGAPRRTLLPMASSSASLWGSLAYSSQVRDLGMGHVESSLRSAAFPCSRRQALPYRHCSTRSTSSARTGLRWTYRNNVYRCSSLSTGNDLNRPWYRCPVPLVP